MFLTQTAVGLQAHAKSFAALVRDLLFADRLTSTPPVVMAGETALPVVQRFCYLGSVLSSDANIDQDISSRIAYSFGRLASCLWDDHEVEDTMVSSELDWDANVTVLESDK